MAAEEYGQVKPINLPIVKIGSGEITAESTVIAGS